MSDPNATVFVVDDDASVRKAVSRLLRSVGWTVETFASPAEFVRDYETDRPGCAVLDVAMPDVDGLELQRRLAHAGCSLPIVFLTGQGDIPMSVRAMKAGAIDFLTKPVGDEALLRAVGAAVARDRALRRERAEIDSIEGRLAALTSREREVLAHVVAGKLNKQIAADLGTVEKTIKVHRGRMMQKMGAASVASLVRMADRAAIKPAG